MSTKLKTATGPLKKRQKWHPKQNIALFLLSSTMMVALCLHLNFRKKVRIRYWDENEDFGLIESDDLLEIILFWNKINLAH